MSTPDFVPRMLLTPPQAAKALQISPRTLWTLTARNEIRAVRIGRSVRYSVDDLHAYIDSQKERGAAQ